MNIYIIYLYKYIIITAIFKQKNLQLWNQVGRKVSICLDWKKIRRYTFQNQTNTTTAILFPLHFEAAFWLPLLWQQCYNVSIERAYSCSPRLMLICFLLSTTVSFSFATHPMSCTFLECCQIWETCIKFFHTWAGRLGGIQLFFLSCHF